MPATVQGATQLRRTLHAAAEQLDDLTEGHERVGQLVASLASRFAPRRSGRLAASVGHSAEPGTTTVYAAAPYAGVIHGGWPAHGINPDPFVSDAWSAAADQAVDLIARDAQRVLDTVQGA